jgi:heptosyltransferase-2
MKILLVQTSYLGDVVLSTPVIAAIKHLHPDCALWAMTTPAAAALIRHDPLLDGILHYDKHGRDRGPAGFGRMVGRIRRHKFERVYSLHKSYRTALLLAASRIPLRIGFHEAKLSFLYHQRRRRPVEPHDVLRNLALLAPEIDFDPFTDDLRLFAPPAEEIRPEILYALAGLSGYAVLVPGSAWTTKRWQWQGYREVARHLLDRNLPVVLLGAPAEKDICDRVADGLEVVNLAGRSRISDAMHVVRHAALVVCNDSMSLHMASAFKVPNVAIFCATSPAFGFGPWKNRALVVERKDLECKPCAPHGGRICPARTEACIQGLPPEEVIEAVESLLSDSNRKRS